MHIESGKVDEVLTLPYAALQYRYGVNRVFVVNGDQLAMRELKVGERLGDRIEIVSGVKAGEPVAVTDVDKLADGVQVAVDQIAGGRVLSELCVRRPVFATMLVMSLVVLGIFSFRDLGVDLFPKADPATVNVSLLAARREPRRDVDVGGRADGGGDQRRLRHRRDSGAHHRGHGQHHRPVRARARPQRRRERRAREGRRRDPDACRRSCCRRSSPRSIPTPIRSCR